MALFGPPNVAKLQSRHDLAGLVKALGYARDARVRRAAATALGEIGDRDALPALQAAHQDPDQQVRNAVAAATDRIRLRLAKTMDGILQLVAEGRFDQALAAATAADPRAALLAQAEMLRTETSMACMAGDDVAALRLFEKLERIYRDLGDRNGLATSLSFQGEFWRGHQEYQRALELHRAAAEILRELDRKTDLARCLNHQAVALGNLKRYGEALPLLAEGERLWREVGDQEGLARCLGSQATLLLATDPERALQLSEEAHRLAVGLGQPELAGMLRSNIDVAQAQLRQSQVEPKVPVPAAATEPTEAAAAARSDQPAPSEPPPPRAAPAVAPGRPAAERVVRVFISSTFRDMQEERDLLVKRVFPELRRRCRERFVELVEVDLRWGVTEAQAERGEVLPICLAEIERCQPYFVGILGERYGWVPTRIPAELAETQPWLRDHPERSATELEMLHGVLLDPAMASRAFFYFRAPEYLQRVPLDRRADYQPENPAAQTRLTALKDRIRSSGLRVRDGYLDPPALGQQVLEDLWSAIDQDFPAGIGVDPLDQAAAAHAAFAAARTRVYLPRPEVFEALDRHAAGQQEDSQPAGSLLAITGEAGVGKSALLASWAGRYTAAHPEVFLLAHHIGSTAESADWAAMLRRIMGEIGRRFGLRAEIPSQDHQLAGAFANCLNMAAARGEMVLLLDGLDHLADRNNAPDLPWLPEELPAPVRLVVSTGPGRTQEVLARRGCPRLTVEPLSRDERMSVTEEYLAQYRKKLGEEQAAQIAAAPPAANPLYLRVLLDELRVFGVHEQLYERLVHYLTAPSTEELYGKILVRLEQDYETERPGLVREALSTLWAARQGLAEPELLEVLGTPQDPLAAAVWSPLRLALGEALVSLSGLLALSHEHLRRAVERRYLPDEAQRRAVHLRLAEYFTASAPDARQLEELPWQLVEAGAWDRLATLLADPGFLARAWAASPDAVRGFWARVERNSTLRMADAYRPLLAEPSAVPEEPLWSLAHLLLDAQHTSEARSLYQHLADRCRSDAPTRRAAALANLAAIQVMGGDLSSALAFQQEAAAVAREQGDVVTLANALSLQANILQKQGKVDEALQLFTEAEVTAQGWGDNKLWLSALYNKAILLRDRGETDRALEIFRHNERICRQLGYDDLLVDALTGQVAILEKRDDNPAAIAAVLDELQRAHLRTGDREGHLAALRQRARLLKDGGDVDGALALRREEEGLQSDSGEASAVADSLNEQATLLRRRGDLTGALALLEKAERLLRKSNHAEGLAAVLGNRALLLMDRGDLDGAIALMEEEERLCRAHNLQVQLALCLGNHGNALQHQGNLDGAEAHYQSMEDLCRELGRKGEMGRAMANRGMVRVLRGDLDGARVLAERAEQVCGEAKDKKGLAGALHCLASICHRHGEVPKAAALLARAVQLHRELGDRPATVRALDDQIQLLLERDGTATTTELRAESASLHQELGDRAGLAKALGRQANTLHRRGALGDALALYREQEAVARQLPESAELALCLGYQAEVLKGQGDAAGALRLQQERERLCESSGDRQVLSDCLASQGDLLASQGLHQQALEVLAKQERICREAALKSDLAQCLGNQAAVWCASRDLGRALQCSSQAVELFRAAGDGPGLVRCLLNDAVLRLRRGDDEAALARLQEAEPLTRSVGDSQQLVICLTHKAQLLEKRGDAGGAMAGYQEIEKLFRASGDKENLQRVLSNRMALLLKARAFPQVLELAREQERICREISHTQGLASALYLQAMLLPPEQARPRAREAYRLAAEANLAPLAAKLRAMVEKLG